MKILLLALLLGAPGDRELIDRIVAVVNEEIITLSELETAAKPFLAQNNTEARKKALFKDVLDQLINDRLLSQQIKSAKLTVTEDEVERAIKDILKQNKITEAQLRQAIEGRNMSYGQYREDIKSQLIRLKIVDMKVRSRVVIPERDIKSDYEDLVKDEKPKTMVSIRHIFFRWSKETPAEERARIVQKAEDAKSRILKGEKFEAVAKELSQSPTAERGGDLGENSESDLLPALAKGIKSVEVGKLSAPIKTDHGVHIVRVEKRYQQKATTYAQVRDKLYQQLYQREVERQMKVWLDDLRGQSAITIRL